MNFNKKILSFFAAVLILFSSCGKNESRNDETHKEDTSASESVSISASDKSEISGTYKSAAKEMPLLSFQIDAPKSSDINSRLSYIKIHFSGDDARPAARENLINKSVASKINISPKISGEWWWEGGNDIVFIPSDEWTPDTEYKVSMSNDIFNPEYKLLKNGFSFKSEKFKAFVESSNIVIGSSSDDSYWTAKIGFNYRFNQNEFKEKASLNFDGKPLKFRVSFDKSGYYATVKSDPLDIKTPDKTVNFKLPKIKAQNHNKSLAYEVRDSLTVPKYDDKFFYMQSVDANIIRNKNGEPAQMIFLSFSKPVNLNDLTNNLAVYLINDNGDDVKLDVIPNYTGNKSDTVHGFEVNLNSDDRSTIVVKLSPNLYSSQGFKIKSSYSLSVGVPPLPKELYTAQNGALLSLSSDRILTFTARGLHSLNMEVGKILPEQVQHIISNTRSGGLKNADFKIEDIDATNYAVFSRVNMPLASSDRKRASYASVNINDYSDGQAGLYYVKATGLNKEGNIVYNNSYEYDDYDYYDDDDYYYYGGSRVQSVSVAKLILVTDMSILRKENADGSSDVFVASISKGVPVKDAVIEVIGKNGVAVISGKSDSDGHFHYGKLDFKYERTPIAILAKKGGDVSFLPLDIYDRRINYSKFDVGGEYQYNNEQMKTMVFTDRGIYRPGETVQIAGITKSADWSSVSGALLEITVRSPNGQTVLNKRHSLNKEGIFDIPFPTEQSDMTGIYKVSVFLDNGGGNMRSYLGGGEFELREFDTDTMRVFASIPEKTAKGWIKPDKITGRVRAENMFGTAASGRRIKWDFSINPRSFYFKEYKDYVWTDPYTDRSGVIKKVNSPNIKDGKTDANGMGSVDLSDYVKDLTAGTYIVSLAGEVFEAGSGDGVTAYDTAMVSPSDYLVGYMPLNNIRYLNVNYTAKVRFIAVNNELEMKGLKDLEYRLIQVTYASALVKSGSGYRYQSVKRYNLLDSGGFSISEKGSEAVLPASIPGDFIYEIADSSGTVIGKVNYFVAGSADTPSGMEKDAELNVKLDKDEYDAGGDIRLNITAPYSGYGLITIEKEKVYYYKWFKSDTSSGAHTVRIPQDMEGNGYVNVAFIRDMSSKEIFSSPLSYAAVPFSINKNKRRINVELQAPETVYPGDNFTVRYKTDKKSKIIVYGVDEGILQVASYSLPNPIDFFMKKKALGVATFQTADLILPDYKILKDAYAAGGGVMSAELMLAKKLNPFARAVNAPVVFWSQVIDADGEGSFTANIPSYFNGTMKIMAVASSESGVGSAETSLLARSPVVIVPNMPYAVSPGDTFRMSAGVTNVISGVDKAEITVTAKSSPHLKIIGETSKTVTIEKGREATLIYDVEVMDELGGAEIVLTAESGALEKTVSANITASVRPPVPYRFTMNMGSFEGKEKRVGDMQRDMYPYFADRKIGVSASPLWSLSGLMGYLETYPYGCSEQITSKIYPLIVLADADKEFMPKDQVMERYNYVIDELQRRQKGSRGFSLWSGGSYIDTFASIYVMQFLTDAKAMGYPVPNTMMNDGLIFLQKFSGRNPNGSWDASEIAYACYILARNGVVVSRELGKLEEYLNAAVKDWKTTLTASYIGAAHILMKNDNAGRELLKSSKPSVIKYLFYGDYDNSLLSNARYIYLSGLHAPDLNDNLIPVIKGIISDISGGYFNSISAAYSIAALRHVSADKENLVPEFIAAPQDSIRISETDKNKASFTDETKSVLIKYPERNKLGYNYYIAYGGFDKTIPKAMDNGIRVNKVYKDKTGAVVSDGKQGDEITVQVSIARTYTGGSYKMMTAVTDLLPGGVEIIPGSLLLNSSNISGSDMREDRAVVYINLYGHTTTVDFTYKIKLLSSGSFVTPPAFAEAMYRRDINGSSSHGRFIIKDGN